MKLLLPLTCLALFLSLAYYANNQPVGYTLEQVEAVNRLVAPARHRMTKQEQNEAIRNLWEQ